MRKTDNLFMSSILLLFMTLSALPVKAQDEEFGFFDHLGGGISLGTDGIGIDVATPLTDWAAVRAGISFWPKIKYERNFHLKNNDNTLTDNVDVEAKLNIFDFKLLADFYPIKTSSFHITAGAFIGSEDAAHATNTSMFIKDPADYGKLGLVLGEYRVTTDKQGYAHADVKVNSFKPYIGIGFGRAVPKKSRVSVSFDLGVKFWGKPGLGAMTEDDWGEKKYHKFSYKDLDENDDEDLKDGLKTAEKIIVFPVLNIRLSGRIL